MDVRRSPLADTNRNFAFTAELLAGLAAAGVRDVCLCPGSRSAPLAAAAATTPGLAAWPQLDERSAGFFALGLARARRAPVALVCTSGTAAANFLPAVVEASGARVPLVVLTADRPPELRDWGAPQTILQPRLFGEHARWSAEAPTPDALDGVAVARALAARLVHEAAARVPGPVHLNLPLREPLDPAPDPSSPQLGRAPVERWTAGADVAGAAARLVSELARAERPVVLAGPWDGRPEEAMALAAFARRCGAPLLAEPLSQLRFGTHVPGTPVIGAADALLRDETFATAMAPDLVVRVGAAPTSKALGRWLARHAGARVLAVDEHGGARDPGHRVDTFVHAPVGALFAAARVEPRRTDPAWTARWCDAEKRAWDALASYGAGGALVSPAALRAVVDALPEGGALVLANSLAVRDAESFLPPAGRALRVFGNRGANGIDGTLSTALGVAASGLPAALVTGDLAFLHDVGALFAARRLGVALDVLVVNDGGGGIFDFLPIAGHGSAVRFEETFRLAHDAALAPIARGFGASAAQVDDVEALRAGLAEAASGVRVFELRIAPERNAALHRQAFAAVARAIAGSGS
jgi:2-succinyl-5-enolpyruvyl-6-hydroxy-3-cyclohexene-1-carboxylate synthase